MSEQVRRAMTADDEQLSGTQARQYGQYMHAVQREASQACRSHTFREPNTVSGVHRQKETVGPMHVR